MAFFSTIYFISVLCSLWTISTFIEKKTGLTSGLFLILCPIVNTIWVLFNINKLCLNGKDDFIKDLKKLFDIK